MKITSFLIAFFVGAALFFIGCKKTTNENPRPTTFGNINSFFRNSVPSQHFFVNVDNGNATITGEKGTTVTFPQNAFTTTTGTPVTGEINITLKEIYDKSDMVLSNKPTTSNGQLLVSGGEIFIQAYSNGHELQLKENTNILITMPSNSVDTSMSVFVGNPIDSNQFNWDSIATSFVSAPNDTAWIRSDSATFYYDPSQYIFSIPTLGWINCDRFYNLPNKTPITIRCFNAGTIHNMRVFIIFHNINSVASIWSSDNSHLFSSSPIPVNEEISIVAITQKDNKEFFDIKDVIVTNGMSVNLYLKESSFDEITNTLKGKFN